ncbi:MAG: iron ABC transporter permease [Spirochaetaceae bacterium]|nr:MAG: iron ABC transporter permease [Spirochaetaceae bacterium]
MAADLVIVDSIIRENRVRRRSTTVAGVGVVLALCALCAVALSVGSTQLTVSEITGAVFGRLSPLSRVAPGDRIDVIVWHLRMPRILMAVVSAAGLAVAGAVMQGVLRNPLVSPFTVGVSGGAVLGASVAIVLGASMVGIGRLMIVSNAFVFALGTAGLIVMFGRLRGMSPESFILVGIALTSLFSALTSILQYIATEGQLAQVVYWTFGSLQGATYGHVAAVAVVLLVTIPPLFAMTWHLNAMASGGDEVAGSLGVRCGAVRVSCMMLAALLTATIVSFTGIIGFVGLVGPHIARSLVGSDHRVLIPFSGATGAILLLIADTAGRTLFAPVIIPVGIVISVIGAPFFFYLLLTRRRRRAWA